MLHAGTSQPVLHRGVMIEMRHGRALFFRLRVGFAAQLLPRRLGGEVKEFPAVRRQDFLDFAVEAHVVVGIVERAPHGAREMKARRLRLPRRLPLSLDFLASAFPLVDAASEDLLDR